jgi:hypothetical protein
MAYVGCTKLQLQEEFPWSGRILSYRYRTKILAAFGYEATRGILQKSKSYYAVLLGILGFIDQKPSKLLSMKKFNVGH